MFRGFSEGQRKMRFGRYFFLVSILALASCFVAGQVFAQASYFQNKTIKIIRGGSPGGTGDLQARALIPFLKKHIPGDPTIIVENLPGAAGRKAANHIFSTAKPDGLSIGAVGAGLVAGPILGLPGSRYDLDKLIYLGSTESGDPYVFVSRKEAGFDSLEKLRAVPNIRIGAQAVGHPVYVSGRLFAFLLGLKDPRMVIGYGGPELDLALERGEVDVRANGADTIFQRARTGLAVDSLHFHATISIPKGNLPKGLPRVPELETFAKSDREHQLINLFRTFLYPRWPYIISPGTPKDIVAILRGAFSKALKDPGFHAEFKKLMTTDPTPLIGEQVEVAIRELPRDPEIVSLYKRMADQGPLPAR
jgi:tripartite-type tricarboxylate transporter receptor subunit TctC